MDELDRRILNEIQKNFPIVSDPWEEVGARLGVSGDEVFSRVKRLAEGGLIRRIGAVFDPGKLGFASTLCAARVPGDRLEAFVRTVNAFEGVTHNYERDDAWNVWFTVIAPSEEELDRVLGEIRGKTGIREILDLRSTRKFKIDATFEL
ncbi:MAG TPA: AsnC family transcriptional regulator [Syntrophales bacterium]|nr:AsnC family transcriptional regulator [Syntrophales bacterium]HQN78446.1 AsnC family transcriptional regulator [Syntrophales bacterium]HQQ27270.1 AsnC family transcriptional regulator [Syntrophales bacterium]